MQLKKFFLSLLLISSTLYAETNSYTKYSNEWRFELAPMFLWGMNMKGNSDIGRTAGQIDLDFKDDIFENLDAGYSFNFAAQKGDYGFFTEYLYLDIRPSATIKDTQLQLNSKVTNQVFELGTSYTLNRTQNTRWDILGGLRNAQQTNTTKLNNTTLIDVSEDWTDFFIGARNYYAISKKWSLVSRADMGAGGSDFVWNLGFMFDYRFTNWGSVSFGYKWLDYDYNNGKSGTEKFTYNVMHQGPLLGLKIHW